MTTDDLIDRKIINYLRKNASNKENQNQIRNKILGLYYKSINGIPINYQVSIDELIEKLKDFPDYFQLKSRQEILNLYNEYVCPRKKIITYFSEIVDYDINENTYLEISLKTFRPIYQNDWKYQTELINKTSFNNQYSFYNYYLKYYLQKKDFPSFDQFLNYIYYKTQKPVHKDIKIVFDNIEKSYEPIKEFIKLNNLIFKQIKQILINSVAISNRIELQS